MTVTDVTSAVEATAVAARFGASWAVEVETCALLGVRYIPGVGATATYSVAGRDLPATIGVLDVTSTGTAVRRAVDDPALPGLAAAMDPAVMEPLLGGRLTSIELVRYRPGQRAVLRYELTIDAGAQLLFGKVLPAAARVAESFVHLSERRDGPFVPAPLLVDEGMGLLVLPHVDGPALHAVAFDRARPITERQDAFRATGRAVAAMHSGRPPDGFASSAPLAELEAEAAAVRDIDPDLADRWGAVASSLVPLVAARHGLAPSHGALRTDQVVLSSDGPALLDLDGFGLAPPAHDLGNFVAYLRWRQLRHPADIDATVTARQAFLEGYSEISAVPAEIDAYEALSLLKITARRYTNLDVTEWPLLPDVVTAAANLAMSGS